MSDLNPDSIAHILENNFEGHVRGADGQKPNLAFCQEMAPEIAAAANQALQQKPGMGR